ncbi:hypothetical protein HDF16_005603 [Granulicella aggregans]|uniref:Uncharacterized protein n=1 Tax=Granulicella aggregans TaxID=474949 RepID=A0A7W7ZJD4_9BACT|nr:hypothetical protein [Granulicella aggregans]MBB5060867.1 hypothetical protein [Granulicella aggregans]
MKKSPIVSVLPAVLAMLALSVPIYAQAAIAVGKWYVLPDGKSEATTLVLTQSGDAITGNWTPPKGAASPIENGKIAADTLTFSFTSQKKQFNATGHLVGDTMTFDIVGPKKWGQTRTIHATAARGEML